MTKGGNVTDMDCNLRPLKVIVCGAGIGGLCAAIALRNSGHDVAIYEQSQMAQETGAAIHVASNCYGLLRRLGMNPREHGSVEMCGFTSYKPEGPLEFSLDMRPMSRMWQNPYDLIHRAHLHNALKEIALSADGSGKPVELHLRSSIVEVNSGLASATLKDGTVVQGDLVIGADGVHSITRKAIPSGDLKPYDCGKSAYRFLVPTEVIAADPKTAPYLQHTGHLLMWIAEDRRLVMYPCVNGTMMNFVAIHPSKESSADSNNVDWQQLGNKNRMLKIFSAFDDSVIALLDKADTSALKVWTLFDMEKMPSFTHGKFALIGDAAHPFLPHQAQGGAQAIEDALSLAAVLPLGTMPDEIPERLEIYNSQRYDRSHRIQEFTRMSGEDLSKAPKLDRQQFMAFNLGHDEWHASTGALQRYLNKKNVSNRYRSPYGFGPAPGPRQPLGFPHDSPMVSQLREQTPETMSTLSIKFRTSRTLLENLLPPGFAFVSPATVCEATLAINTIGGMMWLGGGGYSFFGLSIHGIKYTKRTGEILFGSYSPLLLENLADPIVTGRDDVGMPKLYAEIQVLHDVDRAKVELSWRGTKFGFMDFEGFTVDPTPIVANGEKATTPSAPPQRGPPPPPDNGTFVWRFVPAVGEPGKADAEYAVFVPKPNQDHTRVVQARTAAAASFKFEEGDWKSLPTLHHITRVLAEIPQFGIVSAKHIQVVGVEDLSNAFRIE